MLYFISEKNSFRLRRRVGYMKKIIGFLSVLLLTMCLSSVYVCASDLNTVIFTIDRDSFTVNGIEKKLDTPAKVIGNRTYVPVRGLVEALGGTAGWNDETRTVIIKLDDDEIRLTIESVIAFMNGEEKDLDAPPLILNGRTLLPARFIAESFGYDVVWNEGRRTITVTKADSEPSSESTTLQSVSETQAQYASEQETAETDTEVTTSQFSESMLRQPHTRDTESEE